MAKRMMKPILDVQTRKEYAAEAAAGRALAHLVKGDPMDPFVWFKIQIRMPDRFRTKNAEGEWAKLELLILTGEVATCGVIELEVLYSARSEKDLIGTRSRRAAAFPRVAMSEEDFLRAEEVIARLAKKGQHRVVSLPDLLIAAAAERARLVVRHYDSDYDVIAAVTRQPVEWVAPRGSL